jgi:hypothetical protein
MHLFVHLIVEKEMVKKHVYLMETAYIFPVSERGKRKERNNRNGRAFGLG